MLSKQDALLQLNKWSDLPDCDVSVAHILLLFSVPSHQGKSLQPYYQFFERLVEATRARHDVLISQGSADDAGTRLAALKYAFLHDLGCRFFDPQSGENMRSALDMMAAIDSRFFDQALIGAVVYETAAACGWDIEMLNFPSQAILRMQVGGQSLIVMPAHNWKSLQAYELRDIVKEDFGDQAELTPDFLKAMSRRDICVFVHNQLKLYQIDQDDYEGALETVQYAQAIAPHEYRLYLDAGILYARTRQTQAAIFALNHYISKAKDPVTKAEAEALLQELKDMPQM